MEEIKQEGVEVTEEVSTETPESSEGVVSEEVVETHEDTHVA